MDATVKNEVKSIIKTPNLYKVIMLNDDFTTQEFVIFVLISVFNYNHDNAIEIMREIHTKGQSLIGSYPLDIAKTKVNKVKILAENETYPLQCLIIE